MDNVTFMDTVYVRMYSVSINDRTGLGAPGTTENGPRRNITSFRVKVSCLPWSTLRTVGTPTGLLLICKGERATSPTLFCLERRGCVLLCGILPGQAHLGNSP